ncbi:MAG: hypothetical protein CM1200mP30_25170 [Pseudomonadota bacterium]|nr:MAG: hypothetical protein CM1200mP30_25170 [Pseudomonadota bacterium]
MVEIGSSSKVLEAFTVPAPAEPTPKNPSSTCHYRGQGSRNCRAAFHEHERDPEQGVLRGRYIRGHHHQPLPLAKPFSRGSRATPASPTEVSHIISSRSRRN